MLLWKVLAHYTDHLVDYKKNVLFPFSSFSCFFLLILQLLLFMHLQCKYTSRLCGYWVSGGDVTVIIMFGELLLMALFGVFVSLGHFCVGASQHKEQVIFHTWSSTDVTLAVDIDHCGPWKACQRACEIKLHCAFMVQINTLSLKTFP